MVDFMGMENSFQLGISIGCQPENDIQRSDAALQGIVEVLSLVV